MSVGPLGHISDVMVLFLVSHFNFLFVPCGGLSWLPVSFLLHVKYTPSYCIVWRKGNINRTVYLLQYCLPCNHAQWHKQFLLVGQMDCALVLLNLALSSEHLCIFRSSRCHIHDKFTSFSLPFSELSLVGLATDLVD